MLSRVHCAVRTRLPLPLLQVTKMGHKVKGNDEIQIQKEEISKESEPVKMELLPEPELPLVVVYEDEHLAVINKTPGISVHPSPGTFTSFFLNLSFYPSSYLSHSLSLLSLLFISHSHSLSLFLLIPLRSS